MPKNFPSASPEILEAALHGLEAQRQKLEEQIAQVRGLLGRRVGRPPRAASPAVEQAHGNNGNGRKRSLSEEARKRIAAAQKRRWAAYRKSQSKG